MRAMAAVAQDAWGIARSAASSSAAWAARLRPLADLLHLLGHVGELPVEHVHIVPHEGELDVVRGAVVDIVALLRQDLQGLVDVEDLDLHGLECRSDVLLEAIVDLLDVLGGQLELVGELAELGS